VHDVIKSLFTIGQFSGFFCDILELGHFHVPLKIKELDNRISRHAKHIELMPQFPALVKIMSCSCHEVLVGTCHYTNDCQSVALYYKIFTSCTPFSIGQPIGNQKCGY